MNRDSEAMSRGSDAMSHDSEVRSKHPDVLNSDGARDRLARERADFAEALQDARKALRTDAARVRQGLWVLPTVAAGAGFLGALVLKRLFR